MQGLAPKPKLPPPPPPPTQAVASEQYLRGELARLREVRVKEYEERAKQHKDALAALRDQAARVQKAKDQTIQVATEEERIPRGV